MRRGNYKFLQKFSWYVPGVGGMFGLLAWLLVGALLGGIAMLILQATAGQEAAAEYGNLLSYPIMFIPPMLYASARSSVMAMDNGGYKLDSNHFFPLGGLICSMLVVLGTLATAFWAELVGSLLPEMPSVLKEALEGLTSGNILLNFIAVSLFAPFFEEWLCRGMVLRGLLTRTRMKPFWAILVSAVFFAIIHMNPWQAIPAFILGCLFGYVYYKTGSLKLTMLMHFTNNTFALICGHIDAIKDMETWHDVITGPSYWILIAASVLITVLVALTLSRVRLEHPEGNMDPVPSIFESNEV